MTRLTPRTTRASAPRAGRFAALHLLTFASLLLTGMSMAEAAIEKPKLLRTDWQPASSMTSVSERGGIVVVPTAALDVLNDGLSASLQDPSRPALQTALPGPSAVEPALNMLAIQVTTNPISNLPADALVTGIEVQLAINTQAIDEKGTPVPDAQRGFSIVDEEVRFYDPAVANGTGNRAALTALNYGGIEKFVTRTYGGSRDLWGTPELPMSATFYRGNSLFLEIKLRNLGTVPALVRADQFRFRLHYQLPTVFAKKLSDTDQAIAGLCQQAPLNTVAACQTVQQCYANTASRRQVCDLALSQLLAKTCATQVDDAACSEQAATLLDSTLNARSWSIPARTADADQRM